MRIYINRVRDGPSISTEEGSASLLESVGIYVRVKSSDMTVLRELRRMFRGNLSKGQWQAWNEEAANLLQRILPYLKTGKRRTLVRLVLEFHGFAEGLRMYPGGQPFFTADNVKEALKYEQVLAEITATKG